MSTHREGSRGRTGAVNTCNCRCYTRIWFSGSGRADLVAKQNEGPKRAMGDKNGPSLRV